MTRLSTTARVRLMQGALLIALVVVGVRAASMQWVAPAVPPEYGDGLAPRLLRAEPSRGLILDRDGEVLARNEPAFEVRLVPGLLPEEPDARRDALLRLEAAAGIPYATLERAAQGDLARVDPYTPVVVADGLERSEAIALRARVAGLTAMQVEASPIRRYIDEPTLAHILGYVGAIPAEEAEALTASGYPLNGRIGLAGVEAVYEEAMRGTPGRRLVLSDPRGREVELIARAPAVPGDDAVLAIDLDLQRAAAEALTDGMDAGLSVVRRGTGQQREAPVPLGAAVVMDVRTGELLASVSLPAYDPNLFVDGHDEAIAEVFEDPARPLIDRTYMSTRSPGSIFKPLVALAALEEGTATADTRIYSSGAITIRDQYDPGTVYVFRDWMAHGELDLRAAIARSSDVYFYLLVGGYEGPSQGDFEGMGVDTLAQWARAAGLGRPTGVDLPGETSGLVPDTRWKEEAVGEPWVLGDSYPFAIGQGYLTVTPLQMAVVMAAIANGGDLLQPRVLHGFRRDGVLVPQPATVTGRLEASEEHFRIVREGMLQAASPGGTAVTGAPEGVRIGGKTGTAEFGRPYPDGEFDTHGWYIGFAPYDDPEVAVAVYLEYGVGSTHAGPVAKRILEAYFTQQAGDDRVEARP